MKLDQMSVEAAKVWLDESMAGYARDLVDSLGLADAAALARVAEQVAFILPDGVDTQGHSFCWLVDGERRVGGIWFGPDPSDETMLYLYDVVVDEGERGRGVGSAAVDEVVATARQLGYAAVGLSVFDDNLAARRLYERKAFEVVSAGDGQTELRLHLE